MLDETLERELISELANLSTPQRWQVLEYARSLNRRKPRGVTGQSLLRFAGSIRPDDLITMAQEIEEGCEQVNLDEW